MSTGKRRVRLDRANNGYHLPDEYPRTLADGLEVGAEGIAPDGPQVTVCLKWVGQQSARSADTRYGCTPAGAAAILASFAALRND
jgi:hypothetical protein